MFTRYTRYQYYYTIINFDLDSIIRSTCLQNSRGRSSRACHKFSDNNQTLNLCSSFVNLINFGVPHQFLNGILCVVPVATEYLRTHQQQTQMKWNLKNYFILGQMFNSHLNSVASAFIRNIGRHSFGYGSVISVPSPLIRFPSGSHPGQTKTLPL